MTRILLTADWVLPVTSDPILDGAVLVEDGNIEAVGPREEVMRHVSDDVELKEFGDAALLPGLVNCHTHLEHSVMRGLADTYPFVEWLMNLARLSPELSHEQRVNSARLGALEAISSGTTTVADVTRDGSSIEAITEAGLRAVVFQEVREMDPKAVDSVLSDVDKRLNSSRDIAGKNIQIALFPDAPYAVAPQIYKALAKYSRESDLLLGTHLATGSAEREFVMYGSTRLGTDYRDMFGWGDHLWQPMGVPSLKYLEQWDVLDGKLIAMSVARLSDQDLELLMKYKVRVVACCRASAKLGAGFAPLGRLTRRDMRLGLGTESVSVSNNMDMFDEMRISLLLHRGAAERVEFDLFANDYLWMATMGGAAVLGLEDKIGSLEPGKNADIIAVDFSESHQTPVREVNSALVYGTNEQDIMMSMVDGNVLFENELHLTMDEIPVIRACDEVSREIRNKLN